MKRWIHDIALALVLTALTFLSILGWLHTPTPETVIIERTDTIYRPPVPEFIEAFRLQCEWVAR